MSATRVAMLLVSSVALLQGASAQESPIDVEQIEPDVADLMEKNMMDGVEPSEEASGIEDLLASAVDNEEVMSPDDALEFYTDDFGNRLRKETHHKYDSNGVEYTETAITSDKPFESGEVAELMAEFIAEQMYEELQRPNLEETQQTEQMQGGMDDYDAEFMDMLETMTLDENMDEEEFDAALEEMYPEESADEVIGQLEEQAKAQAEQLESAFGAGMIDTVIEQVGTLGSNYDDTYDAIISSLSSANVEEEDEEEMMENDDEEYEEEQEGEEFEDYNEEEQQKENAEDDFEAVAEEIVTAQVGAAVVEEGEAVIPEKEVINPDQAIAEQAKSSTSPLWVLTVLFIGALGYGMWLNIFSNESKGYSRKGQRDEEDTEAIRLTTYGSSKKGKRLND